MTPELHTPRLVLKALQIEDAEQIQRIFPQWEVVRYLNSSVPWPYPSNGALGYCRDIAIPAIERGDEWHWTLRLKTAPNELIGAICLNKGDRVNRGFWLAPPWQNQGLMTEAVVATNEYWFDDLGFEFLRVHKAVLNAASRRISEKTGMRLTGVEEHNFVSGKLLAEIWEITADEWQAAKSRLHR